ncbi:MAG: glycosyltransferase [Bacteroidales bacterium]|nr:glycosyltransferase [Bacteroidales bacterium]
MNKIICKVIMAESSDIYHDGRILKEAYTLSEAGYDLTIYGFRNSNSLIGKYPFKIHTILIFSKKHRALRNLSIGMNIIFLNVLLIFKKAKIYHAHNTMFLPGMYIASLIHKGELIYDCHEVQWELNSIAKRLEEKFIYKAKYIINVAKGRTVAQMEKYNIPEGNFTIISNYPIRPTNRFTVEEKVDNELRFIYSGGFILSDNRIDNFCKALKHFKNIQLDLMAFGTDKDCRELSKVIDIEGLNDRVKFIELVPPDKVIDKLAKYDIAINLISNPKNLISYNYHGINKIYEYLMAGLPILCSTMKSFIEEIENNGVGKCVEPSNVSSIIDGIQFFIDRKSNLTEMKQKARILAETQYNWNTQGVKLIDLYSRIRPTCVE